MLTVSGHRHQLTRQWADALASVVVRHPNRGITLLLHLEDDVCPNLFFNLDTNLDSDNDAVIAPFQIVNVALRFFPGERLVHQWIAAAWGCFLQHEALELVHSGGKRVLNPHTERFWLDHMFHKGFPFDLTPETLLEALATAVPREVALQLIAAGRGGVGSADTAAPGHF
jgi:hypothetical protein